MLEPTTSTTISEARVGRREVSAEQLAEHEGLVRWVVRQQWLGGLPFADALHEGRVGLWRALQSYDRSRGTRLSSYAVPAITRAVWRAVSEYQPPCTHSVRHEPLATPTVERVSLGDLAETVYRAQVRAELHRLVGALPPRLRQVIVAHYGLAEADVDVDVDVHNEPQTFAAIGSTLGVTRQRIQQLHIEALLWLAQPAHSLALRRLLERHQRRDYQQFASRQRKLARTRRGYGCTHRRRLAK